ncbi:hypothetical protein Landi51_07833 [Colletotrichum acutatum]
MAPDRRYLMEYSTSRQGSGGHLLKQEDLQQPNWKASLVGSYPTISASALLAPTPPKLFSTILLPPFPTDLTTATATFNLTHLVTSDLHELHLVSSTSGLPTTFPSLPRSILPYRRHPQLVASSPTVESGRLRHATPSTHNCCEHNGADIDLPEGDDHPVRSVDGCKRQNCTTGESKPREEYTIAIGVSVSCLPCDARAFPAPHRPPRFARREPRY